MSRSRPNSFKRLSKVPLEVVKESSPAAVAGMSSTESSGLGAACTDSILRRISEKMLSNFMMMPITLSLWEMSEFVFSWSVEVLVEWFVAFFYEDSFLLALMLKVVSVLLLYPTCQLWNDDQRSLYWIWRVALVTYGKYKMNPRH